MEGRQTKAYRSKELIEEIRKRPRLWSPAYKYCTDKASRDANWIGVAQALFANFELMSSSKKITFMKKRWKNIRDQYIKESKRRLKCAKSKYKDCLKFLDELPSIKMLPDPVISERTECTKEPAPPPPQPPVETNPVALKIIKVEEGSDYGVCEPGDGLQAQQLNPDVDTSTSSRAPEQFEGSMDYELHPNNYLCEEEEHIDEDKSFLLSLLPEIRKLSGVQKIDFKIAVLSNLKSARYSGNQGDR